MTQPMTIDLFSLAAPQNLSKFTFGTSINPAGVELSSDGVSLLEDGRRITPVMGEFHYARYPRSEWRDELLKMQAGGIDILACYVFWIHHEEVEGCWDFAGDRDLRAFVKLCGEVGFRCVVRCGPWCHGEVRNGGLPEWLLDKPLKIRTDDLAYLAEVQTLYAAIAGQLRGLLWKDGGPVLGVQIENEYSGAPEHLLSLKRLAVEAGLDVPIYTRTGWPELSAPMPFGQLLPLFGGYAEGFWDRSLTTMPGHYWKEFFFKRVRTDAAIASEHFGVREVADAPDAASYPYLTCEIGPGMMCSYHRRITVFPMDVLSMVIVKLGSGSNSPGYYMYHGGTNPAGQEPWLQEHQATRVTNYNDLPVKTYDFQTALGEFGQVREQYHLLRPMHLFLRDFGDRLAPMGAAFTPDKVIEGDTHTFRWAVRTDGRRGFVFVNNYHRLQPMPDRPNTRLTVKLKDGEIAFPSTSVAADCAFVWPFNFELGDGITLVHATAQLVCQVREGDIVYTVFAETGNSAEFAFAGQSDFTGAFAKREGEHVVVQQPAPGTTPAVTLIAPNGRKHLVILLDEQSARQCYKGMIAGRQFLVLTPANAMFDGRFLRLSSTGSAHMPLMILPPPVSVEMDGHRLIGVADGAFSRYSPAINPPEPVTATIRRVRDAGPLRTIQIGAAKVAAQPTDAEFDHAATWHVDLPGAIDPARQLLLRIHYVGDVARAYLGNVLLTDNFYNGTPFEIGVNRFGPDLLAEGITLKVMPLQSEAPIYMLDAVRPDFQGKAAVAALHGVDVIESHELRLIVR